MKATDPDRPVIDACYRHFNIPEHAWAKHRIQDLENRRMPIKALRAYRAIYASLVREGIA